MQTREIPILSGGAGLHIVICNSNMCIRMAAEKPIVPSTCIRIGPGWFKLITIQIQVATEAIEDGYPNCYGRSYHQR